VVIGRPLVLSRDTERGSWPLPRVIDRRGEEPGRVGIISEPLGRVLRDPGVAVAVLNRVGRAKLVACAACGDLATCEACGAALGVPGGGAGDGLVCPRCATARPAVCRRCGGRRLKLLRPGVGRVREDLERLLGEPVVDVTAATASPLPLARVYVGTDAVLYRLASADTVAFLDLDAELTAPRFRAAERAISALVRAARLLGGRRPGGRLVIQTRLPDHPVFDAVRRADPQRVVEAEAARRRLFGYPPFGALAEVSGPDAGGFARDVAAAAVGVTALGPRHDAWLLTAATPVALADAIAAVARPAGVRIAVDPPEA
jgi:primosomal protein N' (replication factor Y)